MQEWLSMVQEAERMGRRFARVRVVSVPLSDYSYWGYEVAEHNIRAGEDIRYLEREQALACGLPQQDYWLFDSRKALRMDFDEDNRFLGGEVVEAPRDVVKYNYWRDIAQHYALGREEFATRKQFGRASRS
jgi:hypothetical protein